MTTYNEKVTTGRTLLREWQLCQGCNARLTIGEPRTSDDSAWWQRLRLTEQQRDLLLLAAAEYRDLCEEAGEYQDVVEMIDWLSPSVLESLHYRKPA